MAAILTKREVLAQVSIARLAEGFEIDRKTVSKRLDEAGVRPSGQRDGYPVYRLRDAAEAILGLREADGVPPEKMKPADRRAHWQAENERQKFEQQSGQLILADEVQSEMASLVKSMVRVLETLPDTMERDLRCPRETVEYVQKKIRDLRTEMAAKVATDDVADERISA